MIMEMINESIIPGRPTAIIDRPSRVKSWTGAIIGTLLVAFLIFDSVGKILQLEAVIKGSAQLGLSVETVPVIGYLLLICTVIYVIPPTRILGAILLTGYLGGAIAMHVRAGNGTFPVVFSGAFGVLAWVALVLREPQLFRLLVLRQWPRHLYVRTGREEE